MFSQRLLSPLLTFGEMLVIAGCDGSYDFGMPPTGRPSLKGPRMYPIGRWQTRLLVGCAPLGAVIGLLIWMWKRKAKRSQDVDRAESPDSIRDAFHTWPSGHQRCTTHGMVKESKDHGKKRRIRKTTGFNRTPSSNMSLIWPNRLWPRTVYLGET